MTDEQTAEKRTVDHVEHRGDRQSGLEFAALYRFDQQYPSLLTTLQDDLVPERLAEFAVGVGGSYQPRRLSTAGRREALHHIAQLIDVALQRRTVDRCNVPMNHALESLDSETADGLAYWMHYRRVWTRWNHVRTIALGISTLCFLRA